MTREMLTFPGNGQQSTKQSPAANISQYTESYLTNTIMM